MKFSTCTFQLALVAVYLAIQVSARDLPTPGILSEMPSNCTGFEFCHVKHEKYPQEWIDELLAKKYRLTLGTPREETEVRYGDKDDGSELCEKDETYGPIYEIIDENEEVRVVVQSERHFKQQLRIERCLSRYPRKFNGISSTEMENNDFECVEKKLNYSFLVLTRDGNGVELVKSIHGVPVCCSCKLQNVY